VDPCLRLVRRPVCRGARRVDLRVDLGGVRRVDLRAARRVSRGAGGSGISVHQAIEWVSIGEAGRVTTVPVALEEAGVGRSWPGVPARRRAHMAASPARVARFGGLGFGTRRSARMRPARAKLVSRALPPAVVPDPIGERTSEPGIAAAARELRPASSGGVPRRSGRVAPTVATRARTVKMPEPTVGRAPAKIGRGRSTAGLPRTVGPRSIPGLASSREPRRIEECRSTTVRRRTAGRASTADPCLLARRPSTAHVHSIGVRRSRLRRT
jgi:hypothetical protein